MSDLSRIHGKRVQLDYETALSDLRELVPDAVLADAVRIVSAALDPDMEVAFGLSECAPRTNTRQFCARCHSVDRVGFLAPKPLWKLVAGPRWEHDILCLRCFAEIGDEKGVKWDVPELEFWPVSYVTLAGHRDAAVRARETGDE